MVLRPRRRAAHHRAGSRIARLVRQC